MSWGLAALLPPSSPKQKVALLLKHGFTPLGMRAFGALLSSVTCGRLVFAESQRSVSLIAYPQHSLDFLLICSKVSVPCVPPVGS